MKLKNYSLATSELSGLNRLANFKVKELDKTKWQIISTKDDKIKARGFLILNPEDGGRSYLLKFLKDKSLRLKLEFDNASKLRVDDFARKEVIIEGQFSLDKKGNQFVNTLMKIYLPE